MYSLLHMYLVLDTETGGLDPQKHSLLTASFVVLDDDLKQVDKVDLSIAPDEAYRVTPEALRVNKIDIVEHSQVAMDVLFARTKLCEFLDLWSKKGRLTVVGHNVGFDLRFIYAQLLPQAEWESRCSYRVLDTQVVAQFLQLTGVIPGGSASLKSLAMQFGVPQLEAHTASDDALVTAEVLRRLFGSVKGFKADFGGPVS
jgi:DNA polymerase III epsilon subunit-like protein